MSVLDPAFAAAVAEHESYEADWVTGEPADLRRVYEVARRGLAGDIAAGCRIAPLAAGPGLAGLLFRPDVGDHNSASHAILYFHGGSWVVGSPETHRVPCSHLAVASGLPVYSLRYRLAPEHPFPSQREDGLRAVAALLGAVAGGPRRVFLAGDSAGAAVAFWTEAALPPGERAQLAGVIGLYGAYGRLPAAAEEDGEAPSRGLSRNELLAAYRRLGPLERLAAEQGFSIIEAIAGEGPPCYLAVGSADPLIGDSEALAARLRSLGRPVALDVAPGLGHSYAHYAGRVPAARAALDRLAAWIREAAVV